MERRGDQAGAQSDGHVAGSTFHDGIGEYGAADRSSARGGRSGAGRAEVRRGLRPCGGGGAEVEQGWRWIGVEAGRGGGRGCGGAARRRPWRSG
uniref:Uncharacterized protein n=1 Tax=Arundo donax TaxID=35708 RepID=A0A0A9BZ82_ARUDO